MALSKKQHELDVAKWEKSEQLGKDACGTFDYCGECDKSLENPCDKAFTKLNGKKNDKKTPAKKEVAATAVKKTTKKKTAKK